MIDGAIPCQAKEEMTVGEWVKSDYYKNTPTYDAMEGYFTVTYHYSVDEMDSSNYREYTFTWNLSLSEVLVGGKSYESTGNPSGV